MTRTSDSGAGDPGWTLERLPSGEVQFALSEVQRFAFGSTAGCFTVFLLALGGAATWSAGRLELFGAITLGLGSLLTVLLFLWKGELETWRVTKGRAVRCLKSPRRTKEREFTVERLVLETRTHDEGTTITLYLVERGQTRFPVQSNDFALDVVGFARAFAEAAGVELAEE